jgi:hypothetical protein
MKILRLNGQTSIDVATVRPISHLTETKRGEGGASARRGLAPGQSVGINPLTSSCMTPVRIELVFDLPWLIRAADAAWLGSQPCGLPVGSGIAIRWPLMTDLPFRHSCRGLLVVDERILLAST